MNRRSQIMTALVLVTGASTMSYLVGRADAVGVPTSEPLYYGGVIQDDGALVEGRRTVAVKVWNNVDSADEADLLCATGDADTAVVGGRFRVTMPDDCRGALAEFADVWTEVTVDGTSLGRTKVGAVPYALNADHAVTADAATIAERSSVDFNVGEDLIVEDSVTVNGSTILQETTATLFAADNITAQDAAIDTLTSSDLRVNGLPGLQAQLAQFDYLFVTGIFGTTVLNGPTQLNGPVTAEDVTVSGELLQTGSVCTIPSGTVVSLCPNGSVMRGVTRKPIILTTGSQYIMETVFCSHKDTSGGSGGACP